MALLRLPQPLPPLQRQPPKTFLRITARRLQPLPQCILCTALNNNSIHMRRNNQALAELTGLLLLQQPFARLCTQLKTWAIRSSNSLSRAVQNSIRTRCKLLTQCPHNILCPSRLLSRHSSSNSSRTCPLSISSNNSRNNRNHSLIKCIIRLITGNYSFSFAGLFGNSFILSILPLLSCAIFYLGLLSRLKCRHRCRHVHRRLRDPRIRLRCPVLLARLYLLWVIRPARQRNQRLPQCRLLT